MNVMERALARLGGAGARGGTATSEALGGEQRLGWLASCSLRLRGGTGPASGQAGGQGAVTPVVAERPAWAGEVPGSDRGGDGALSALLAGGGMYSFELNPYYGTVRLWQATVAHAGGTTPGPSDGLRAAGTSVPVEDFLYGAGQRVRHELASQVEAIVSGTGDVLCTSYSLPWAPGVRRELFGVGVAGGGGLVSHISGVVADVKDPATGGLTPVRASEVSSELLRRDCQVAVALVWDGTIIWASSGLAALLRCGADDLHMASLDSLVGPEARAELSATMKAWGAGSAQLCELVAADGALLPVEITALELASAPGTYEVVMRPTVRLPGQADEPSQAPDRTWPPMPVEATELASALLASQATATLLVSPDGTVLAANSVACDLFGAAPGGTVALPWAAEGHAMSDAVAQASSRVLSGAATHESLQVSWDSRDGKAWATAHLSLVPVRNGGQPLVLHQYREETVCVQGKQERHALHDMVAALTDEIGALVEELKVREQDLRRAALDVVARAEGEKRALAAALHDGPIQEFHSCAWALEDAELAMSVEGVGRKATSMIESSRAMLKGAVDELRRTCFDLFPPALDSFGLVAAVEGQLKRFCSQWLAWQLEADHLPRFEREVELVVFRTVQESVRNVVKHAHGTRVDVELRYMDCVLEGWVVDDGVGTGADGHQLHGGAGADGHVGLTWMEETLRLLGGSFELVPNRAGGTTAHFVLPAQEVPTCAASALTRPVGRANGSADEVPDVSLADKVEVPDVSLAGEASAPDAQVAES